MAQLDKLIEKVQLNQEIILESGKAPMLKTETGSTAMFNQLVSTVQLCNLLQEIAPPACKSAIAMQKPTRFDYAAGGKSVVVTYTQEGDLATAKITLANEPGKAAEPAHAAAPAAAAAPTGPEPEINILLRKMFKMNASDLHMTSCHKPLVRLHGDMKEFSEEPVTTQERMSALLSPIIPQKNADQFEETHDTDFAHEIKGLVRFRVNMFRDRFGIGAVFRQIPMEIVTAEKLNLSKEVMDLCFLSKGLVLVTGPTGSGKSTTLCAIVDYINRHRKDHIITIEDPIEFVHERKSCLINQREVHVHTKSFSAALRAALREDPDIVLVGEMRDLETISIAIETAETGHLVFGTLHTTTAASTVDRIIDQFPADRQGQIRAMLSSSLKAVVAQTLCKKLGGGRIAAMELLFVTSAISNLIREGKIYQIPSIMQTGKQSGMVLLNDALFKLVCDKQVAPEEAYIKAIDKPAFVAMLKTKNITVKLGELDK
ncbi:MAG: type IV pilus twitching motility protein PilT [Elusimicrobiota bacterium]|nr:type IV pilus twitching motility protein PilT [Elusimicrobiota bacterium]